MANKTTLFADRLLNITLQNGLVRIDLGVYAGTGKTQDGKNAVKVEATHQLVIPLDGFLAAMPAQQALAKQVIEAGQKRRAAAEPAPDAAGSPDASDAAAA